LKVLVIMHFKIVHLLLIFKLEVDI
jgi:hypothetical protein